MGYRHKFRSIFYVEETPHRIALSFAIGIFWGLSPLLGLHTIIAFFTAWLLGLNRFIAVAGVYITNPWTIIPIYSFSTWVGIKVMGMKYIFPPIDWGSITLVYLIEEMKHLIPPFIVGTLFVGTVSAIISYFIVFQTIARYQKRKARIKHAA